MAEITAAAARAISDTNSGIIETELDSVYTGVTARATAGFYYYEHVLTVPSTKSAVIAHLVSIGYVTEVYSDEVTIKISWEAV